jgi:hypothetical protein
VPPGPGEPDCEDGISESSRVVKTSGVSTSKAFVGKKASERRAATSVVVPPAGDLAGIYIFTCAYAYIYIYVLHPLRCGPREIWRGYMYLHIHMCIYIYVYIYMYMCIYINIYMNVHFYTKEILTSQLASELAQF